MISWFWHFAETFPPPFRTSFLQSSHIVTRVLQSYHVYGLTCIFQVLSHLLPPKLLFPNDYALTRLSAFKNGKPEHETVKISFLFTFKDASRYVLNSMSTLLVHQWRWTWRINIYRYRCRYRYDFYPTHQNSKTLYLNFMSYISFKPCFFCIKHLAQIVLVKLSVFLKA